MADATLEAEIVPDTSAIEQVQNEELELGGGGDLSASQRNDRENVVSGGFRSALAATGILGLLASLKPLTATVGAILGLIGRSLIPVIELVAEFLRPLEGLVNKITGFIGEGFDAGRDAADDQTEKPLVQTAENALQTANPTASVLSQGVQSIQSQTDFFDSIPSGGGEGVNEQLASVVGTLAESQSGGKPDLSGEASKIDKKEEIQAASQDIVGAFQE